MPSPFDLYVAPARPLCGLWRTGLGTVLVLIFYLAINAAAFFGLGLWVGFAAAETEVAKAGIGTTPGSVMLALGTFIPLAVGVALITWALHKRSPSTLMGQDWGQDFLRGILAVVILGAVSFWVIPMEEPPEVNLPLELWLAFLGPAILLVGIQTLAEEVLFRGYLQQQLGARFQSPLAWMVLPSVLFGLAHASPDLLGPAWPLPVVAATLFGLIAADLTARHGNIGAAWGLHLGNNTVALLLVATHGQLSGLSLYVSPYDIEDVVQDPWLTLGQITPLILAWVILRQRRA